MSSNDPVADLRRQLTEIRNGLAAEMIARGYAAGLGMTLAGLGATIDSLDETHRSPLALVPGDTTETTARPAPACPAPPARASHAIVEDGGGLDVDLVLLGQEGELARVALDRRQAIGLAAELLQAAHVLMAR
jgi:hypothetical protein